jgi:hypothetical protein
MTGKLDGLIARSIELAARLAAFDGAVSGDRQYLTKAELRSQRAKAVDAGEAGEAAGGAAAAAAAAAAGEELMPMR